MTPPLPPASIRRCSARSRSFLLGPDGPAGAPPGQALRSGALIGLRENREQKLDPHYKVSTVRGEPRNGSMNRPLRLLPGEVVTRLTGDWPLRVWCWEHDVGRAVAELRTPTSASPIISIS